MRTDRLELRALTLGDLDELASMLTDADGLTYWGPPLSREESRSWIERNLRRYELDGFGRCAVILLSTGELVGDCGLARMRIEGQPVVELGWIVRRTHRGKGIATEAAAAWRDYAFDALGLERIVSMVSENNVASRRVAEKLGMTVEREAIMDGLPHLMYSMRRNLRNRHESNARSACRGVRSSGRDVGAASSSSRPGWGCRTADQRRVGWVW